MSEQLQTVLARMEKQYTALKLEFADDGNLSDEEIDVLRTVLAKLQTVRDKVGSAGARGGGAKPYVPTEEYNAKQQSLGPSIEGPTSTKLWAFMNAQGYPMETSDSKTLAHLNDLGFSALNEFGPVNGTLKAWLALVEQVEQMSKASVGGLKKMEESAIGNRSGGRVGAYVRQHSEEYVKAQRAVKNAMREVATREAALREALSKLHEAGLGKKIKGKERDVEAAKGAVETEKKRVEEAKKGLTVLLALAVKAVKQDWTGIIEDAVKYVGGELINAIPTGRLANLEKQLVQATTDLKNLQDELVLAKIETASQGLSKATKDLEDGRADVVDKIKDFRLAQKTVVEALGESGSTSAAAQMIALRQKMLELMDRTRKSIQRYQSTSTPYLAKVDRLALLYKGVPSLIKTTRQIDPQSEYGRALAVTALENYAALGTWKRYFVDFQASGKSALAKLADTGDTGYLAHFNRVPEVLEKGLVNR